MADRDDRDAGLNDNAAKTWAIIALIVAVIALGWAIKADKHASDAAKIRTNTTQNTLPINTSTGTSTTDTTKPQVQ